LSAITRCPQTVATDGVRGSVSYTVADRFCLDGQRLVVINAGNYGAAGTEYRTEVDSFSRVVANGAANGNTANGPDNFVVKTKAGVSLEYGTTADSRIEAQGRAVVRVWALRKMTDTKGNYLTVSYTEGSTTGEFYPLRIDYTGNGNQAPGNSVRFVMETRTDIVSQYFAGSLVKNSVRLKEVQTFVGAALVKSYKLTYEPIPYSIRASLSSVSECTSAQCLPAIVFGYGIAESPVASISSTIWSVFIDWGADAGRAWVDVDGDGLPDYCRAVGGENNVDSKASCAKSTGTGIGPTEILSGLLDWGSPEGRAWVDVNGDGLPVYCRVVGSANHTDSGVTCSISHGTVIGPAEIKSDRHLDWGYPEGRAWVDINGDGLADYCRVAGGTGVADGWVTCALSTGTEIGQTEITSGFLDGGVPQSRAWADVNGDGLPDFCRGVGVTNTVDSQISCTLSMGTNFDPTPITSGLLDWGYTQGQAWVDVNGDGLADYCRVVGGTNITDGRVACTLSTGTGFGQTLISDLLDWGYPEGRTWTDVNGDGLADYCRVVGVTNHIDSWVACTLCLGTGFGDTIYSDVLDWGGNTGREWADANGDGLPDFCRRVGNVNNQDSQVACTTPEFPRHRLESFTGTGRQSITVDYAPLTNTKGTVYFRNSDAVSPQVELQFPLYVVKTAGLDNGIGGNNPTVYSYGGLKAERGTGRGMLGFSWMKAVDSQSLASRQEFNQSWPFTGTVKKSEFFAPPSGPGDGAVLKRSSLTYAQSPGTAVGVVFPYLSQGFEEAWDLTGAVLPTTTTLYEYSQSPQYGDPTKITVTNSDGSSKTTVNVYLPADTSGSNWILGRLQRATVTSTKP
jgi:hypothetical protein